MPSKPNTVLRLIALSGSQGVKLCSGILFGTACKGTGLGSLRLGFRGSVKNLLNTSFADVLIAP